MSQTIGGTIESASLKDLLRSEVPLFKSLKQPDADQLLLYFKGKTLSAGEVLWREGDEIEYLAYVLSGKIELKKETEFKGKQFIVGLLTAGAMTGGLTFFNEGKSSLTVEVLEDCLLAVLEGKDYRRLEEERPDLALFLVKNMLMAVSLRLQRSYERFAAIF
ncbi:MAG: cyclic nucleotide-binding domain-containing protein [Syntrophotaleaceae bacterium]